MHTFAIVSGNHNFVVVLSDDSLPQDLPARKPPTILFVNEAILTALISEAPVIMQNTSPTQPRSATLSTSPPVSTSPFSTSPSQFGAYFSHFNNPDIPRDFSALEKRISAVFSHPGSLNASFLKVS